MMNIIGSHPPSICVADESEYWKKSLHLLLALAD